MRIVVRVVGLLCGVPLLLGGAAGLLWAFAPEAAIAATVQTLLDRLVSAAGELPLPWSVSSASAVVLRERLSSPELRFVVAPVGFLMLAAAMWPARRAAIAESPVETSASELMPVDRRMLKRTQKQAVSLRKKGQTAEAAEMLLSAGLQERAADYFVEAGELVRAAEIRHDQNRFVEAAELYLKAGRADSAATIFSQQEEYQRAGECYLECDSKSLAAEMFEKAGDFRLAADCYRDVGFMRHAAQCYVRCKSWPRAADCLAEVCQEESTRLGPGDAKKQADLDRLVRSAGQLYERSRQLDKALAILIKGGADREAAEVALRLEEFAKAAELFRSAGDAPRAAEALRQMGEDAAAERVLGEYHRDRGERLEAAQHLELARDLGEAGDLYRQLEDFTKAGECFESLGDGGQAGEMFRLAGDRARAADCFEQAKRYTEAAECCALEGLGEREAPLLEKAEEFMRAGEVFHREGLDDDAIKVLQKVEPGHADFSRASALLGDIFRSRGKLSLAIKKLQQAIDQQDIDRENLTVFYTLATVHQGNSELGAAVEIYEKILAFDYHYKDVEERLIESRERGSRLPVEATGSDSEAVTANSGHSGRYRIVGELGRGGMGIVYKAKDTVLDRLVAYKVLPDTLQENPQALRNFQREAQAAAKLNHPNIVTIYDTGEQDGRYYIAMEHVDGTTLKEILRRRGPIAAAGILHVVIQVCEALAYAHEKKVVHRDIKTANTMWTRDKKAKIMDFGLAKVQEEVRNHTTVVSGTPYYMSPEQTLGKNVDHRTDIYSLGVMGFELATGVVPFHEGNIPYHHVHTPAPDLHQLKPELPPGLAAIVNRCLLKDPAQRYQSAREILAEARRCLGQSVGSKPS